MQNTPTHLLRDMALFVEVVRTKSFTRAALHLDMPSSTLSRRIAALERAIGLRLLHRTTRRVEVTEAGAAYYARCAHLVEEARVAHDDLASTVSLACGTLRMACAPDFAMVYLPPVLAAYTRLHPQAHVELDLSPRRADLLAENLDAALRIGRLDDSALVARRVATVQLALYATPGYLRVAPPLDHPRDLAQHMCLRMRGDEGGSHWTLTHAALPEPRRQCRVAVTGRVAAPSVSLIRQLCLLGAGIGIIDQQLASADVASGQLVPVLPAWTLAATPVHLLTASRLVPARVRLFGDLVAQMLAPQTA